MSLGIDRGRWSLESEPRVVRWRAAATVAGLAGSAALLPDPARLIRQVAGNQPIQVLSSAMLLAAAAVVWLLLGWAVVVGAALAAARLPGSAGRAGRAAVRHLTPPTLRRALLVAAGVSLIAGTSACAHPAEPPTSAAATVEAAVTVPSPGADTPMAATVPSPGADAQMSVTMPPAVSHSGTAPFPVSPADGSSDRAAVVRALPDLDWPVQRGPRVSDDGSSSAAANAVTTDRPTASDPPPLASASSMPSRTTATPGSPDPAAPQHATPRPTGAGAAPTTATAAPTAVPAAGSTAAPAAVSTAVSGAVQAPPNSTPDPTATASSGDSGPAHPSARTTPADDQPQAGASVGDHHSGPAGPGRRDGAAGGTDGRITRTVTVRPGDSLWSIAARHLGPGAGNAQVDAAWRAWYAANRAVIGADPDLILPGQVLQFPDSEVIQP